MGFLFNVIKPKIFNRLNQLERRLTYMLEELKKQVQANTDVIESAIILIEGLHSKLEAAGTNEAALKELKDSLAKETEKLAASVAANTDAEPSNPNGN